MHGKTVWSRSMMLLALLFFMVNTSVAIAEPQVKKTGSQSTASFQPSVTAVSQFVPSGEVLLLEGEKDELLSIKKKLRDEVTKKKWRVTYLERAGWLLFQQTGRPQPTKQRAEEAKALDNRLSKITNIPRKWGYQTSIADAGGPYLFPTGKIYVLYREGLSHKQVADRIGRNSKGELRFVESFTVPAPEFRDPRRNVQPLLERKEKGGRTTSQSNAKEEVKIQAPIAILTMAESDQRNAFQLAHILEKEAGILVATSDFHLFGKGLADGVLQANLPPSPEVDRLTARNLIRRAWELFIHDPDVVNASGFRASNRKIALFDRNFVTQPNIPFELIGYDAADGDRDPTNPFDPVDYDGNFPQIFHATYLAGLIAGLPQNDNYVGVAAGSVIIPTRPYATADCLEVEQGWAEIDCSYPNFFGRWWNALYRLYQLSHSEGVEVASMGLKPQRRTVNTLESLEFSAWMNWFITNSLFGRGILFSAAAGNNEELSSITYYAQLAETFAVGQGDFQADEVQGNSGPGKDLVVDGGLFPQYVPQDPDGGVDHPLNSDWDTFGSSASTAVVAGVAAMMRTAGSGVLTADEMKEILRRSARVSPNHRADATATGFNPGYGFGFLDAYHAVKIAYKDFALPLNIMKANYLPSGEPSVVIQASFPTYASSYAGEPSGELWSLEQTQDNMGVYWKHSRTPGSKKHADIVIDRLSPMGQFVVAGDFDGNGRDDIAMQMGYWAASPEHHVMVRNFDAANGDWEDLGTRVPTEFPSGHVIWTQQRPVSDLFVARIDGAAGRDQLLARQGGAINAAGYDSSTNKWEAIGPIDYEPSLASSVFPRVWKGFDTELLHVTPFIRVGGSDILLVLGRVRRRQLLEFREYLTASLLRFDSATNTYVNLPLDMIGSTHVALSPYSIGRVEKPMVHDFNGDGQQEAVISVQAGNSIQLIYFDLHQLGGGATTTIAGHAIYTDQLNITGRLSKLGYGDIDGDGATDLGYLAVDSSGSRQVRFLEWDTFTRTWEVKNPFLDLELTNNTAVDLEMGDYNEDGISEVAVLLERPHRNTYRVFQRNATSGVFEDFGHW